MNQDKELQLLKLENIVKMPRHAWVYRPRTECYYIYALGKHPFVLIQRVVHEADAKRITLELNNGIDVDTFMEAIFDYTTLMEEKQNETQSNQGKTRSDEKAVNKSR